MYVMFLTNYIGKSDTYIINELFGKFQISTNRRSMMKSTGVASDEIVHQVLTKDNYERWRVVMQNYLQGQGLWDGVIMNADADIGQASKNMNDGKGLQYIQLSFGRKILETVTNSSRNHLTNQNDTDPNVTPDLEQGPYLRSIYSLSIIFLF